MPLLGARLEFLEAILWFVVEVFGELLLEIALEIGLASLKAALGRENRDPIVASCGYLFLGMTLGGISLVLLPGRLLSPPPIAGASLFLMPLGAAVALEWWGRYRRRTGHETTNLATWYGGSAFAFGAALVRFLFIR